MRYSPSSTGLRERRLIGYGSNMERLWKQTGSDYIDLPPDKRNLVDGTLHAIGAVVHVTQSTIQSVIGDAVRWAEGNKTPVQPLRGHFARVREDVGEGVRELGRGHIGSAAVKVLNTVGDIIPDTSDFLIGNDHRNVSVSRN